MPCLPAVIEADAYELAPVEAVQMIVVYDEIVEVRLDCLAGPFFLRGPLLAIAADMIRRVPFPMPVPSKKSPSPVSAGCTILRRVGNGPFIMPKFFSIRSV